MTIEAGMPLPEATLRRIGPDGPEPVQVSALTKGRKVVLFAVPGAFTPTCSSAHLPSFIRAMPALKAQGVDEVVCVSVNDVHVMRAWGEASGAASAGITMLADPESAFVAALGMEFSAPAAGLIRRAKRFALCAEDGIVTVFNPETGSGTCEISGGERMAADLALQPAS